jgi:hypothetical protein
MSSQLSASWLFRWRKPREILIIVLVWEGDRMDDMNLLRTAIGRLSGEWSQITVNDAVYDALIARGTDEVEIVFCHRRLT